MFGEVDNDPMKYSRSAASSRYHVASSSLCFFTLYSWFLHRHFSAPVCIMKLSPKTLEAQRRHSTISTFSPLTGIPGRSIGNSRFRRLLFFPGIQSLGSERDWYLLNDAMASLQYFHEIRNCYLHGIKNGTIFVIRKSVDNLNRK